MADAFKTATEFFHACESLKGAEGCAPYLADGATFEAQSEPLAGLTTAAEYCDWMAGTGQGPLAGCSYDLHTSAYDAESRTAVFFATFNGTHNGEGGPVPPTGKSTASHYVYVVTMNDDDRVANLTKIWNAPWAMTELGWA